MIWDTFFLFFSACLLITGSLEGKQLSMIRGGAVSSEARNELIEYPFVQDLLTRLSSATTIDTVFLIAEEVKITFQSFSLSL